MGKNYCYSIVTPVKDEIKNFPLTAKSVLSQENYPREWIIVNDGSTDGTTEFIKELEKKFQWIQAIHLPPEKKRKPGGEFCIKRAVEEISLQGLDFLVRLDGDISFESNYFKELFKRMDLDPELGIAGGTFYINAFGDLIEERNPEFHVRGGCKTYKIECYNQIGGFGYELGWDTIDEIKANVYGWKTKSFADLKMVHLKPTRSASNWYKANLIVGKAAYNSGYHPVYLFARALKEMHQPPYVLRSFTIMYSYFKNYLQKKPRLLNKDQVKFVRKHQINRLIGKKTVWK